MRVPLDEAQARVLRALRDGASLTMHARGERGPYYTLGGRRLSVTMLKHLEQQRWVARSGGPGRAVAAYHLTEAGLQALAAWETPP